ncbi:hypothetical protein GZL_09348 [Streptomyces sp. 769]|nr:hypothetical protein GZL_00065 [Streptomyces sp. 769]AJC61866.1 hypothetical protein GZL_09348 [Streptomyces sp. 769]
MTVREIPCMRGPRRAFLLRFQFAFSPSSATVPGRLSRATVRMPTVLVMFRVR